MPGKGLKWPKSFQEIIWERTQLVTEPRSDDICDYLLFVLLLHEHNVTTILISTNPHCHEMNHAIIFKHRKIQQDTKM